MEQPMERSSTALLQKHMPTTSRQILALLKEHGGLTADDLAKRLGISAVAVRRHLTKLEVDKLVIYEEVQRGMGRPSFVYRLGEAASDFFPRRYQELASDVIETVQNLYGHEAVDAIFAKRTDEIVDRYRQQVTGETLEKRLSQLTQLREADGYMSSWESDPNGVFVLRESNCPIIHVAEGCNTACKCDQVILERLLDAEVERTNHLVQGDSACIYKVRPKTAEEWKNGAFED